jgi:hypothetical protein
MVDTVGMVVIADKMGRIIRTENNPQKEEDNEY